MTENWQNRGESRDTKRNGPKKVIKKTERKPALRADQTGDAKNLINRRTGNREQAKETETEQNKRQRNQQTELWKHQQNKTKQQINKRQTITSKQNRTSMLRCPSLHITWGTGREWGKGEGGGGVAEGREGGGEGKDAGKDRMRQKEGEGYREKERRMVVK